MPAIFLHKGKGWGFSECKTQTARTSAEPVLNGGNRRQAWGSLEGALHLSLNHGTRWRMSRCLREATCLSWLNLFCHSKLQRHSGSAVSARRDPKIGMFMRLIETQPEIGNDSFKATNQKQVWSPQFQGSFCQCALKNSTVGLGKVFTVPQSGDQSLCLSRVRRYIMSLEHGLWVRALQSRDTHVSMWMCVDIRVYQGLCHQGLLQASK